MAIFNSFLYVYQRVNPVVSFCWRTKNPSVAGEVANFESPGSRKLRQSLGIFSGKGGTWAWSNGHGFSMLISCICSYHNHIYIFRCVSILCMYNIYIQIYIYCIYIMYIYILYIYIYTVYIYTVYIYTVYIYCIYIYCIYIYTVYIYCIYIYCIYIHTVYIYCIYIYILYIYTVYIYILLYVCFWGDLDWKKTTCSVRYVLQYQDLSSSAVRLEDRKRIPDSTNNIQCGDLHSLLRHDMLPY